MKRIFFVVGLFAVLPLSSIYAQYGQIVDRNLVNMRDEFVLRKRLSNEVEEVKGSPYIVEKFYNGNIQFKNGQVFNDIPLRLNVFFNELEYRKDDKIYALKNNLAVDNVTIAADTLVYEKFENNKVMEYAFFKRLVHGKTELLVKSNIDLFEAQPAQGVVASKPARYEKRADTYYLKLPDGYLEKISSIKKLIKKIEIHNKELTTYAKEARISSKNTEELIDFVNYINSLL
jgi:hypothetical protein